MAINADKVHLWKQDSRDSVDMFNTWFMANGPKAFRDTRVLTTKFVEAAMLQSKDFSQIDESLIVGTETLPVLRMATCPPIARERLSGLAGVSKGLVEALEKGKTPKLADLAACVRRVIDVIDKLLDRDLFPWVAQGTTPARADRHRAATVVADRMCGAIANPIVKNAQEQRQLALIKDYLEAKGYTRAKAVSDPTTMAPGTFSLRMVVVAQGTNIPIDVVIQPLKIRRPDKMPILIECKSAGDFTNVNKRRKEEAQKIHQIRAQFGNDVPFYLFLCGYFDGGYLGYSATENIDWVWEHRMADFNQTGI